MEPAPVPIPADECFRCGYNLFGIADDQACPECGLLAIRSRRVTDELHETRPRWLRSIYWGLRLILLSVLLAFAWPQLLPYVIYALYGDRRMFQGGLFDTYDPMAIFGPAAILLAIGVILLTIREGYAPADSADYKRRWALRIAAFVPLAILAGNYHRYLLYILEIYDSNYYDYFEYYPLGQVAIAELIVVVLSPMPPLLFLQLRSLAKRARCKYLPHDCLVVGFGLPVLAIFTVAFEFVLSKQQSFNLGIRGDSIILSLIDLIVIILNVGFVLWTLYLLIYFANAFRKAAAEAKRKWIRDDLSLSHSEMPK